MGVTITNPTLDELELLKIIRSLRERLPRPARGYGEVDFNTRDVDIGQFEYITRDSTLNIRYVCTHPNIPVLVAAKILLPSGRVTTSQWSFTPANSSTVASVSFELTEGFLLSLVVSWPTTTTYTRGDTYMRVGLLLNQASGAPLYRILCQGYLVSSAGLAWPEGPNEESVSGQGLLVSTAVASITAGNDLSVIPPTITRWKLRSLVATLTTSATVANRQPVLQVINASGYVIFQSGAAASQTATSTKTYTWAVGCNQYTDAAGNILIPLPGEVLAFGNSAFVKTNTVALQAGDQWTNVSANYEQWWEF